MNHEATSYRLKGYDGRAFVFILIFTFSAFLMFQTELGKEWMLPILFGVFFLSVLCIGIFGRVQYVFDGVRKVILIRHSAISFKSPSEIPFSDVDHIEVRETVVRSNKGRKGSQYEVRVVGKENTQLPEYVLERTRKSRYPQLRQRVEAMCKVYQMSMVEMTEHQVIRRTSDELDRPLEHKLDKEWEKSLSDQTVIDLSSQVTMTKDVGGGTFISFPQSELSMASVLQIVVFLAAAGIFVGILGFSASLGTFTVFWCYGTSIRAAFFYPQPYLDLANRRPGQTLSISFLSVSVYAHH